MARRAAHPPADAPDTPSIGRKKSRPEARRSTAAAPLAPDTASAARTPAGGITSLESHAGPIQAPDDKPVMVDMSALYRALADDLPQHPGEPAEPPSRTGAELPVLLSRPARRREGWLQLKRQRRLQGLAYMLSLEIQRICDDLELRRPLLLRVWSRLRARRPLLNLLRSRYERIRPDDFLLFSLETMSRIDQFYRLLDEFRLYLQVTEDMPTTLEQTYAHYTEQLARVARPLLQELQSIHRFVAVFPQPEEAHATPTGAALVTPEGEAS